jgi:hypothetical protein
VKDTTSDPPPGVAVPIVGGPGDVAQLNARGSTSDALFVVVTVTGPTEVGVTVNVCAADELLNVLTIAGRACRGFLVLVTIAAVAPPPLTVIVIVPVKGALGVIVNGAETLLISPPAGPGERERQKQRRPTQREKFIHAALSLRNIKMLRIILVLSQLPSFGVWYIER